jgi:penicillin-binding protein 2
MALLQSKLGQKKNTRSLRQGRQSLFLIILTLLVTTGIEARLAFLQIMQGDRFKERAASNRIRVIAKQPERGNIFIKKQRLKRLNPKLEEVTNIYY